MKTYSNAEARAEMARSPGTVFVATKGLDAKYHFRFRLSANGFMRMTEDASFFVSPGADIWRDDDHCQLGLIPESEWLAHQAEKEKWQQVRERAREELDAKVRSYEQQPQPAPELPEDELDRAADLLARGILIGPHEIATARLLRFARAIERRVLAQVKETQQENARLRAGQFTEEEFQNLCHTFSPDDAKRFCDGCEEYQRKLFGTSPIEELRRRVEQLEKKINSHDSELMMFRPIG